LARPDTAAIDYFAKAKHSLEIAISLDPFNPRLYRRLGEMYVAKFARSGDRHDAQAAADALTQAVARYPNDSSLCALRATALSAAGEADAAKAEAERALKLDQINRQRAHTDRYLPDAKLIQLHRLATPSAH
jgi:tetratricopeptide (TPR) repeat protein